MSILALSPAPAPPPRSLLSRCSPPVDDVLHVADGILNAPLLGAQDDAVEVGVDHRGAQALELGHQPAAEQRVGSVGGKAMPEGQVQLKEDVLIHQPRANMQQHRTREEDERSILLPTFLEDHCGCQCPGH